MPDENKYTLQYRCKGDIAWRDAGVTCPSEKIAIDHCKNALVTSPHVIWRILREVAIVTATVECKVNGSVA